VWQTPPEKVKTPFLGAVPMVLRALCIGINDYPGTDSDLSGCVNDANDWAAVLKKRGFTVTMLLDRKATGAAIRKAIKALLAKSSKNDLALVQYSGHGSFVPDKDGDEPDGTDECLCPYDIWTKGPITDDELFVIFSGRPAGVRVVMISDSCHSGTVARFAPISTPPSSKAAATQRRTVRFLPPGVYLSKREIAKLGERRATRASSPPGRYACLLLAGCQDTEYSYDAFFSGRANGAFTYVALKALAKLKTTATYKDWYTAIRKALPSRQHPQTPNLYGATTMKGWKALK